MSVFDFLSDSDCTQTEDYLESLADYIEEVLEDSFDITVKNEPTGSTDEILRLLAYSMLTLSVDEANPNIDSNCEAEVGGELKKRLEVWTSVSRSEDGGHPLQENQLWRQGAEMIQEDASFADRRDRVLKYALKRWGDDSDVFVKMAEVSDAESIMLRSVDKHDRGEGYQSWLPGEVTLREAELYANEIAEAVSTKLERDYQITSQIGELSRSDEAIVGTFYLACLQHLPERGIHQGTAVLRLREDLVEGISDGTNLVRAEQYSLFADDSDSNTIISWAASHLEGKKFHPSNKHSHVPRNMTRFEKVANEALNFTSEIEVELS